MKQLTFDEVWAPPPLVDLTSYDVILLNTSGGKDSQTILLEMLNRAKAAGVADRLIAVHCDLGRVEWPGTKQLAQRQAELLGIPFVIVRKNGGDLLDYAEHRGKWPSSQARWCTSDFKRGPVRKLMTQLVKSRWVKGQPPIRILNCMGLRAEESPSRAKRDPFHFDEHASNGKRHVDEYLPIHDWSESQVWAHIFASKMPYHRAYDLGMPRLSCVYCVFSPRDGLLLAGMHNPELLADYAAVERRINHKFRVNQSLVGIQTALAAGERPRQRITWARCA